MRHRSGSGAIGGSMQTHRSRYKIVAYGQEKKLWTGDIPRIRAELRTDKSIAAIAEVFGVDDQTLIRFIKSRGICDLVERKKMSGFMKAAGHKPENK